MIRQSIRPWIASCLVVLSISVLHAAGNFDSNAEEYLQAQMRVNQFSGSVLVARDGQVLLSRGYGMADRELSVPNTPQTEFRLASVTKSFTAIGIMLLQENGMLNVHDLLSKYYPNCPETWKDITLHHLLTHTSGIPEYADAAWEKIMGQRMTKEEVIGLFRNRPLDFKPGERYRYSNSGYFLLGCVIEKASGETYEAFMREHIFSPLHMADTGCNRIEAIIPRRASGYSKNADGAWENAPFMDMSQAFSAGCIYSTVEDMYRLDRALRTETLLPRRSISIMFTPFSAHYGYGWNILTRFNRKLVSHNGDNRGYTATFDRYPDEDVCVIVLSNQDFRYAGTVARDLEAILFGEKYALPKEHKAISATGESLERYVGIYEDSSGKSIQLWLDGNHLMQKAPTGRVFEFIPESDATFFGKFIDASFIFIRDEKGVATELVIREGAGDESVWRRTK